MRALNRLSLKQTLLAFTATAATLCVALGVGSFVQIDAGQRVTEDVLHDVGAARNAGIADMMHDALRGDVLSAMLAGPRADAQERARLLAELEAHQKTLRDAVGALQRELTEPRQKSALAAVLPEIDSYIAASGAIVQAALRSNAEAEALRPEFGAAFARLETRLDELGDLIEAGSGETVQRQKRTFRDAQRVTAAVMALAVVGLFGFGALLLRLVTRPIRDAVAVAQRVAGGDLTVEVRAEGENEAAQLLRALQSMVESLRAIVDQVRQGSDSIATGSAQIAAGGQDLSSRTEEQASNLQQTAASMEQLTSTVKQSADSARQASQLAAAASHAAEKGGAVVGQVVATMVEISASSRRIAEIIGVIDGIAFQTNILALNAAVEAARAGEQGRGFAVVAGEVRNLAQRSAQAAREIKAMISDSVQKVESGSKLVNDAGASMQEIVAQVKRVTDLIGEITGATLEQSSGIGQINQAVTQLDQATQHNAALVEESAAAAASLREQAERLARSVALFKLSRAQAEGAVARAEAASRSGRPPPARPPARPAQASAQPAPAGAGWEEF
jgi:methyl-accepting chemotaxis protein